MFSVRRLFLLPLAMVSSVIPGLAAAQPGHLMIPAGRSARVTLMQPMAQVMIADPNVASVHVHNSTSLTVIGERLGQTALRISDAEGRALREYTVTVGHDLPALRREISAALPGEAAGVDMEGASLVLSGRVSHAAAAERAAKAARDYLKQHPATLANGKEASPPDIRNMLQIVPGQVAAAPPAAPAPMEKLFLAALTGDFKTAMSAVEGPHGFLLD